MRFNLERGRVHKTRMLQLRLTGRLAICFQELYPPKKENGMGRISDPSELCEGCGHTRLIVHKVVFIAYKLMILSQVITTVNC